jgi:hypothetical protein
MFQAAFSPFYRWLYVEDVRNEEIVIIQARLAAYDEGKHPCNPHLKTKSNVARV